MEILVIIDNGHGATTPGKRSPDGRLREWDWTRRLAERLARTLARRGIESTRAVTEDADVPLSERARRVNHEAARAIARGAQPVLVSLHVNAAGADGGWHGARGWQVHTPSASTTRGSGAKRTESERLAGLLYYAAAAEGVKVRPRSDAQVWWPANFQLLREVTCPAVLTENLFMDNRDDVKILLSETGQQGLADVHAEGLACYAEGL